MIVIRILLWAFMPFKFWTILFTVNRFDCMMFGGLIAIAVIQKNWLFKIISLKIVKLSAWLIFLFTFLNYEILNSIIQLELITLATGIIICEQISSSKPLINLENRVLNFLGKYSFGIYIYHPLLILLFAKANLFSTINNESTRSILILLSILTITIMIAYFSFNIFEKRFINLKSKFSIIHSTNERTNN